MSETLVIGDTREIWIFEVFSVGSDWDPDNCQVQQQQVGMNPGNANSDGQEVVLTQEVVMRIFGTDSTVRVIIRTS